MRYAAALFVLALAGCNIPPPNYGINISPRAQRICDYAGQTAPRTDDYAGLRARKACMQYVNDTGHLPPGLEPK